MKDNQRSDMDRHLNQAPADSSIPKESDETIQRLKNISMFNGLTREQLSKMVRICSKKKYASQDQIYKMGEESKDMFILLKGNISVIFSTGVELQSITPTGTVGEMGVFTGSPRSASVTASTDCVILNFNKDDLFRLFRSDLELWIKIQTNIIKDLSQKVRKDNEIIEELMYRIRSLEIL
jgi:CRP-like cAMP-binding protein